MRAPQLEGSHLAHLKPQSNTPSTSATSDSFLSVSLDLWNILIGELEDFGGDKILIAVESRFGTNLGVKGLKSLIIWAKKLDLVEVKVREIYWRFDCY